MSFVKTDSNEDFKEVVFDTTLIQYSPTDKVAIIDGDSSPHFPNLALQKISAWEKRNGVKQVRLIKLKHCRIQGVLQIDKTSMAELFEIKDYDRVYASFVFTRSKNIIIQITSKKMLFQDEFFSIPHLLIGGTGVDEYYELEEGDKRAKPKRITQLHPFIENMYPDHTLYESENADQNTSFWSDPTLFTVPKKLKSHVTNYIIEPIDEFIESKQTKLIQTFDELWNNNGYQSGATYRGLTKGNGYSSKGCPRKCTFCVVPIIQGNIKPMNYGLLGVINWVLPIGFYPTMDEIIELYQAKRLYMRPHVFFDNKKRVLRISSFLTISDNNFTSDPTCIEKMEYMIQNNIAVNINQGMDARLLTAKERYDKCGTRYPSGDELCEKLSKLYFINFNGTKKQMHFSWDYLGVGRVVIQGLTKLVKEYGLKYSNFSVLCLSGFDTTFEEDYKRVMTLKKLGADPYVMLFRNVDGSEGLKFDGTPQDWRMKHLARWTNNKIIFRVTNFENYDYYVRELKERLKNNIDEEIEHMSKLDCFDWLTQNYIECT